jgi:hypothetical protein
MTRHHPKLTNEQRIELVQRLARFDSAGSIIKWLQDQYGITIAHHGLDYYDPSTYQGRGTPERWKILFFETRKAFLAGKAEIGVANKMVRLRWLDAMARDAMDSGKLGPATRILAHAAKETGENDKRRTHDQIEPRTSEFSGLTMAELDQRIADAAAKLGLGVVPLSGADIEKPAGREGEAVEPQPDSDSLSG